MCLLDVIKTSFCICRHLIILQLHMLSYGMVAQMQRFELSMGVCGFIVYYNIFS
jgi:hypothetical protein